MASAGVSLPEELAEDYKSSLEDLTFNSRWEITNLTVIAKENIHAAQAISKVVEEHIQKIAPPRKLPGLYLLDSIAKNVGTPYTLFFGRNLYRTFMDAYSLVEPPIRRKLEEMLQTWKQPVPGSSSSTPVFPTEITRKIDNALIKARTAAVQAQQKQMKQDQAKYGVPPSSNIVNAVNGGNLPYRSTPTPPMIRSPFPLPNQSQTPQPYNGQESSNRDREFSSNSLQSLLQQAPFSLQQLTSQIPASTQQQHYAPPVSEIESLHSDIKNLILTTQKRFSENPFDTDIQKRLKALLDLETIIRTQQLPRDQLALIRDQVSKIAAAPTPAPAQAHPLIPSHVPTPPPLAPTLLNAPNLATLLGSLPQQSAKLSIGQSNTPQPYPPSQSRPPPSSNSNAGNDLFSSLMSAGLLGGLGALNGNVSIPPPPPPSLLPPGFMFPGITPTSRISTPQPRQPKAWESIDVQLNTSSLKASRPHLLPILNESLPSRCSSCARRFENSEQGKKEKAAHLDWHFRVHQRLADSAARGQNRSWYVDEEDWIKSRSSGEDTFIIAENNNEKENDNTSFSDGAAKFKQQYVPVPNDPILANSTCPVCKEKFETVWHGEAEEWVWMDAIKVGGRIYHASCHTEVTKDGGSIGTPLLSRGTTPDTNDGSATGKRKEREDLGALLQKIKRERV